MSSERAERAYEITWLIRRLFRAMAAEADRYLADSELSAADRAVMEFLYPSRELSVPDIARRYDVSRQHVQVTVNRLIRRGLLRSIENPRHKRSRLIRLTEPGHDCFANIRRNESALVERLFDAIPDAAMATTHLTLESLYAKL